MKTITQIKKNNILKLLFILLFFSAFNSLMYSQVIIINEIKYDNVGADVDDTIEIAGVAGIDLSDYSLVLYNGNDGSDYFTLNLTGFIDSEQNGFGAVAFTFSSGIQNGPDGVALVNNVTNNVIQFISYEGSFVATSGPANGMTSHDMNITGTSSTVGKSIQVLNSILDDSDISWTEEMDASYNTLNNTEVLLYPLGTAPIPDSNFEQALIDLGLDDVIDGEVEISNINGVTSLDLTNKNISDLSGISYFTSLTQLFFPDNHITSVDLSNNTQLVYLRAANNQLTDLDISANTSLQRLYCSSNQLTELDISNNPSIWLLSCSSNQLTHLNLSQQNDLVQLMINDNLITTISIFSNTALMVFDCRNNQITALDISQNTNLNLLWFADNLLTELDISNNPSVTGIRAQNNQLTTLDVRNGNNTIINDFNTTNNPNLSCIFVDDASYANTNFTYIDATSSFVETEAACMQLSVHDYTKDISVTIFPNPVYNSFKIQTNQQIFKVAIYDIFGKKVKEYKKQETYNISNLTNGIYIVKIETDLGIKTQKIIK